MGPRKDNILFVDDEQNILDGIKRNLGRIFNVHVAPGAKDGLDILERQGPFAVIVSDMRMPVMDGISFLSIVKERWPDSVRVMLTGNADMETAISAVNEGNIFRFVTKPCPVETIVKIIETCLSQYYLIIAERELLENTLKGSIRVLADILSLTNPEAFSRAVRIRHYIVQMARKLNLSNIWQYEVAALLSQIGYVTVPAETIEKVLGGEELSETEQKMVTSQCDVGRDLIGKIPRLEIVAEMIVNQNKPFNEFDILKKSDLDNPGIIGAGLLKAAIDYDTFLIGGAVPDNAIKSMAKKSREYYPSILDILKEVPIPTFDKIIKMQKISELHNGMILAEDIYAKNRMLIVTKGQEVNDVLKRRLENFSLQGAVEPSVRVYIPQKRL